MVSKNQKKNVTKNVYRSVPEPKLAHLEKYCRLACAMKFQK